jgi:hypothetical protein
MTKMKDAPAPKKKELPLGKARWYLVPGDDKRRPGKKLRMRDFPSMRVLPKAGELVLSSIDWARAVQCGDVTRDRSKE